MYIYRVLIDPKYWDDELYSLDENNVIDEFYPIGCSESYLGFWSQSLKCAINIYNYIQECYFMDGFEGKYPCVIVETPIDNVVLIDDFTEYKFYHNPLFDEDEVFVEYIKNMNNIKIIKK